MLADKTMEATATAPTRYARSGSDLLNEIRQPVLTDLSRALRRAFAAVIDEMLEQLLREKDWDKRQSIDDGLDLLRNGREGIEIRFDRACTESWDRRTRRTDGPAAPEKASAAPSQKPTLSLIDDNAIGDQLQVGRIAARSRRRMDEEQIDGMRARFGAMLGRDWFADNEYPIAPDVVFESLREALSEFGAAQTVFYLLEIFEPKISADLATLFEKLNRQLIELGVLPEIRYHIAKTVGMHGGAGATSADTAAQDDPAGAEGWEDGQGSMDGMQGGVQGAMHGGMPGGMAHGMPSGPQGAMTGARGMPMMPGQDGGMPAGTPHARIDSYAQPCFFSSVPPQMPALGERFAGAGGAGSGGMMPAEAVVALADQLMQRIPSAQGSAVRYLSNPDHFGTPGAGASVAPVTEKLLDALSSLQATVSTSVQDVAEMISTARTRSADAAREHGSPIERLIIETVSLIFEQVYNDDEISAPIKQELLRLQVAAFKAALIDPSFFARPDHPMRQVIERLSAIGADPDFETLAESPLTVDIAELVSWILVSFERDLALFDDALKRIDDIVEAETARRDQRLARIAVAAENAERHEAVRRAVRTELLRDLRPDVPEFIRRMLSEHWSEVLARIRSGGGHPPFDDKRAERVAQLLLWSIAPKTASDIPKLAAAVPQLIADLSRGLAFVSIADSDRELFFSELLALHGSTIDEAKRNRHPPKPVTPAAAAPQPRDGNPRPTADNAGLAGPASPPAGSAVKDPAHGSAVGPANSRPASLPSKPAGSPRPEPASASEDGDTLPMPSQEANPTVAHAAPAVANRAPAPAAGAAGPAADADEAAGMAEPDDAVGALRLMNGSEVEITGTDGDVRRFKLGWMSPARTVFIFSRYPREHRTIRRAALNQMIIETRFKVLSRTPMVGALIESMKNR